MNIEKELVEVANLIKKSCYEIIDILEKENLLESTEFNDPFNYKEFRRYGMEFDYVSVVDYKKRKQTYLVTFKTTNTNIVTILPITFVEHPESRYLIKTFIINSSIDNKDLRSKIVTLVSNYRKGNN